MTYLGLKLNEALQTSEHRALRAMADKAMFNQHPNALAIAHGNRVHYRSFDAFLDAQASKRMVR
jgi:hypothetical protein